MLEVERKKHRTAITVGRGRPVGRFGVLAAAILLVAAIGCTQLPQTPTNAAIIGFGALVAIGWLYIEASFACHLTVVVNEATGFVGIERRYLIKTLRDRLTVADITGLEAGRTSEALHAAGYSVGGEHRLLLKLADGRDIALAVPSSFSPFNGASLADFVAETDSSIARARAASGQAALN